jgi:phospholipid transport system substrate-binding protein
MEMTVFDATRVIRAGAALAILCGLAATTARAEPGTPPPSEPATRVVDELHEALLGVMKGGADLGYTGRYDRLEQVLPDLFDISFMAEKSVGRYWRSASEEERKRLLATFTQFMIANYAGNFDSHSGQVFETLGTADSTHGTTIVETRLVATDGEVVELNYRLRPVDGHWKIIDVYLNGTVSELALRRSEYSALIKREGFEALIVALNDKIANLSEAPPADTGP